MKACLKWVIGTVQIRYICLSLLVILEVEDITRKCTFGHITQKKGVGVLSRYTISSAPFLQSKQCLNPKMFLKQIKTWIQPLPDPDIKQKNPRGHGYQTRNDIHTAFLAFVYMLEGPGGSMSKVVGLPNNSYKPITNTAWVRAWLCKSQKWCTRFAAASDKVLRLLPPLKLVAMI